MKNIQSFEEFLNEQAEIISEALLQYKDSEELERVYVYKLSDKNKDDYVATIDYDGEVELYDEDNLTAAEIKEINSKVKAIKDKAAKKEKEAAKNWIGWFVVAKPINGDLNSWKKGELIKATKSEDNGYVFIETADVNQEAYDDIEDSVFRNNTVKFSATEHKSQANYLSKIDKGGYLKSWQTYK